MIGSLIQFGGFLSHTGTGFQREVKKSPLPHGSCPIHAVPPHPPPHPTPTPAQSMFRGDTLFGLPSIYTPSAYFICASYRLSETEFFALKASCCPFSAPH